MAIDFSSVVDTAVRLYGDTAVPPRRAPFLHAGPINQCPHGAQKGPIESSRPGDLNAVFRAAGASIIPLSGQKRSRGSAREKDSADKSRRPPISQTARRAPFVSSRPSFSRRDLSSPLRGALEALARRAAQKKRLIEREAASRGRQLKHIFSKKSRHIFDERRW